MSPRHAARGRHAARITFRACYRDALAIHGASRPRLAQAGTGPPWRRLRAWAEQRIVTILERGPGRPAP